VQSSKMSCHRGQYFHHRIASSPGHRFHRERASKNRVVANLLIWKGGGERERKRPRARTRSVSLYLCGLGPSTRGSSLAGMSRQALRGSNGSWIVIVRSQWIRRGLPASYAPCSDRSPPRRWSRGMIPTRPHATCVSFLPPALFVHENRQHGQRLQCFGPLDVV